MEAKWQKSIDLLTINNNNNIEMQHMTLIKTDALKSTESVQHTVRMTQSSV